MLLLQRWRCLLAPSILNQTQTHEFVSLRMGLEVWAVRKTFGLRRRPSCRSAIAKPLREAAACGA